MVADGGNGNNGQRLGDKRYHLFLPWRWEVSQPRVFERQYGNTTIPGITSTQTTWKMRRRIIFGWWIFGMRLTGLRAALALLLSLIIDKMLTHFAETPYRALEARVRLL